MYRGKAICNTLKQVRLQVAQANDIAYEPTECRHEGDCLGTCPKCEQEVRFLERELELRRSLGKAVSLVGISVGLAAITSFTSCVDNKKGLLQGEVEYSDGENDYTYMKADVIGDEEYMGEVKDDPDVAGKAERPKVPAKQN